MHKCVIISLKNDRCLRMTSKCSAQPNSRQKANQREYILCVFCFEVSIYVLKITSNEVNDTAVLMGMRNTKILISNKLIKLKLPP